MRTGVVLAALHGDWRHNKRELERFFEDWWVTSKTKVMGGGMVARGGRFVRMVYLHLGHSGNLPSEDVEITHRCSLMFLQLEEYIFCPYRAQTCLQHGCLERFIK